MYSILPAVFITCTDVESVTFIQFWSAYAIDIYLKLVCVHFVYIVILQLSSIN